MITRHIHINTRLGGLLRGALSLGPAVAAWSARKALRHWPEDPALERWLDKLLKQQESSAKRPLHGPWKACPANTLGAKY